MPFNYECSKVPEKIITGLITGEWAVYMQTVNMNMNMVYIAGT